jgi:hypothetical protein
MAITELRFVLVDRIVDFEATCAAAGFTGYEARRWSALYAGLTQSERRVARQLAERLWLPVSFEPLLTGSRFGLADQPATELEARYPAGSAGLALALRHHGAHIAIAMTAELVQCIVFELAELRPDGIANGSADASVCSFELELRPLVAAGSTAC